MTKDVDRPTWMVRVATTLAAWLAAFLIVMGIFQVGGDKLESLPLTLRIAVMTGVMVISMSIFVEPVLTRVARTWMTRRGVAQDLVESELEAERGHPG